ncbi:MAG: hypothetical protein WC551_08185 [Patescibacteria group bacterium]
MPKGVVSNRRDNEVFSGSDASQPREAAAKASPDSKVESPDVVREFSGILTRYKGQKCSEQCSTIAQHISDTGSANVFEDPEALAEALAEWSEYMGPSLRKKILKIWFATKQIQVPADVLEMSGADEKGMAARKKKELAAKRPTEAAVWVVDSDERGMPTIRMQKNEEEPATTLEQAREAMKTLAREKMAGEDVVVWDDKAARHVPNFKNEYARRNLSLAWAAARQMDKAMSEDEPIDPIDAWVEQYTNFERLREAMGVKAPQPQTGGTLAEMVSAIKELREMSGENKQLPDWLQDPFVFQETMKRLAGGGDAQVTELKGELDRLREELTKEKEARLMATIHAQGQEISSLREEIGNLAAQIEKGRHVVGKTSIDLLADAINKLPDRSDIRQFALEVAGKAPHLVARSAEQRGAELDQLAGDLEAEAATQEVADWIFGL